MTHKIFMGHNLCIAHSQSQVRFYAHKKDEITIYFGIDEMRPGPQCQVMLGLEHTFQEIKPIHILEIV